MIACSHFKTLFLCLPSFSPPLSSLSVEAFCSSSLNDAGKFQYIFFSLSTRCPPSSTLPTHSILRLNKDLGHIHNHLSGPVPLLLVFNSSNLHSNSSFPCQNTSLFTHLLSFFESMFAKSGLLVVAIQAALLVGSIEARIWLLERDGRAIYARRFGQEQPEVLKEIAAACGGGVCDTLAGEAVSHHPDFL